MEGRFARYPAVLQATAKEELQYCICIRVKQEVYNHFLEGKPWHIGTDCALAAPLDDF